MLGVLSPQSSGICVTQVFYHLCPVDHVLHGCSVASVQWTMCYTGCSVVFVQWTMCYTGVLSHLCIGPCVTQVFCPLDHVFQGVLSHLSSAPCGTQVFCPVDHVIHIHSVTSVKWTMWYIGVLSHVSIHVLSYLSSGPCVTRIFSASLCPTHHVCVT